MTYVPDLAWVVIVAPIGNLDNSSLSVVVSMAHSVSNLCVSRKVFQKHQVNWNTFSSTIKDQIGYNIWYAVNPLEILNKHLSLLVGCYVPTKVTYVCNKSKPRLDDKCRRAFDIFGCPVSLLGKLGNVCSLLSES